MPQSGSRFSFRAALPSVCLVLALTLMLTWRSTPLAYAQTTSAQASPTAMLVVLKNQPARQIVDAIVSTSGTARKLAEDDFRRISGQAGVPDQMKVDAAQCLLTQIYAQTRQASAEIKAAIGPEQDLLAGRLTGLGATGIQHYTALNMLEAQIPDAALAAVKQDPAVAEVNPVGSNQKLLDTIEQGLSEPNNFILASIDNAASSDPAFLRLIDRIIDDRDALVTAAGDLGAFNTVTGSPDLATTLPSLGSFSHVPVKAAVLNGDKPNLFSDSVSAVQTFRLYTGTAQGPFQSTLVWDRHFAEGLQPYLRNLDLFLYNQPDGAQLTSSESQDRNVEQAAFHDGGELVVKVKLQPDQDGAAADESFALALSEQGFTPAEGPKLSVKCSGENCTARNDGDLPAYNVIARMEGVDYTLGTIAPSASATFSPGPNDSGKSSSPVATVMSRSFGETFSAAVLDPCSTGTWSISAPTNHINAAGTNSVILTVTPPAVTPPQSPCEYFVTTSEGFGFTPPGLEFGTYGVQVITVKAGPNPIPEPRTGVVFIEGLVGETHVTASVIQDGNGNAPSISNLIPNGGESYAKGSPQTITWTYTAGNPPAASTTASIQLLQNDIVNRTLASSVDLSTQSFAWTVPADVTSGIIYKIRIAPTDSGTKAVTSASPFEIKDAPQPCTFTASATPTIDFSGGSGKVTITANKSTCASTITNDSPTWLTFSDPLNGNGPRTANFSASANTQLNGSTTAKTAKLTVQGYDTNTVVFTTTLSVQENGLTCNTTFSSQSLSLPPAGIPQANPVSISVTESNSACQWTASSSSSFVHIAQGAGPTTGNGVVQYWADANTTGSQLLGTLQIAGQTASGTQDNQPATCPVSTIVFARPMLDPKDDKCTFDVTVSAIDAFEESPFIPLKKDDVQILENGNVVDKKVDDHDGRILIVYGLDSKKTNEVKLTVTGYDIIPAKLTVTKEVHNATFIAYKQGNGLDKLFVNVVDANNIPLKGVAFDLKPAQGSKGPRFSDGVTDAKGHWEGRKPRKQSYEVTARSPGYTFKNNPWTTGRDSDDHHFEANEFEASGTLTLQSQKPLTNDEEYTILSGIKLDFTGSKGETTVAINGNILNWHRGGFKKDGGNQLTLKGTDKYKFEPNPVDIPNDGKAPPSTVTFKQ
jgi:Ser-Thr-rich glycosyl-phosphatidyl-inositol-anchored membrane family